MLPVRQEVRSRLISVSDMDILSFYLSGLTPTSVASYGSLFQFKQSKKPKEAGDAKTCLDCAYEPECVWSAKKIYMDDFDGNHVSLQGRRN